MDRIKDHECSRSELRALDRAMSNVYNAFALDKRHAHHPVG